MHERESVRGCMNRGSNDDGEKLDYVKLVYIEIARKIRELVNESQIAYGDSIWKSEDVIKLLFPDGIPPEK